MSNNICKSCNGEGIVGAGDFPFAKQGVLSTCENCAGTGKSAESETTGSEPEEKIEEISVEAEEIKEDKPE